MAKKTKEKIEPALIELLSEKNLEEIDVVCLCKAAGVSRGTFYRYYSSVFDIVTDIKNDIEPLFDFINDGNLDLYHYLIKALSIGEKHPAIFIKKIISISENTPSAFRFLQLEEIIHSKFFDYFTEKVGSEGEILKLKRAAMAAIVRTWLNNNCSVPVETTANMIVGLLDIPL